MDDTTLRTINVHYSRNNLFGHLHQRLSDFNARTNNFPTILTVIIKGKERMSLDLLRGLIFNVYMMNMYS